MGISSEAAEIIAAAQKKIVARGNPLLESLPEWVKEFRAHQVAAVKSIMEAYEDGVGVVILDAPTGSGKTLIAEVARRMGEWRGLYVCHTKSLQDQFLRDFKYSKVLKGRANYPTERYPKQFGDKWDSISAEDCTKVPKVPDSCSFCTSVSMCPYEIAKHEALASPLAVLNTAYFLTESNGPGRFSEGRGIVVADEADLLESALMGYVSVEVSKRRMERYGWVAPKITVRESWREWLSEYSGKAKAIRAALPHGAHDLRVNRERRYLSNLVDKFAYILATFDDSPWVYTGDRERVAFRPSRVDGLGMEYLWKHSPRWLLMSATVISPAEMLDSLGYEGEYKVVRVASTFPRENRRVIVQPVANMSRSASKESGGEELERLKSAIAAIVARHKGDRVLVHTVSYALAGTLRDYLAGVVRGSDGEPSDEGGSLRGTQIISYVGADGRNSALDKFLRAKNGAVLLAPSLDRGVDLPGDACRVQVIAKVPFPNLGDKQVSARLYSKGGQVWYTVQTVRSIVQMTGRAVRSESDWAICYILDKQWDRVWNEGRRLFPKWWVEGVEWHVPT